MYYDTQSLLVKPYSNLSRGEGPICPIRLPAGLSQTALKDDNTKG